MGIFVNITSTYCQTTVYNIIFSIHYFYTPLKIWSSTVDYCRIDDLTLHFLLKCWHFQADIECLVKTVEIPMVSAKNRHLNHKLKGWNGLIYIVGPFGIVVLQTANRETIYRRNNRLEKIFFNLFFRFCDQLMSTSDVPCIFSRNKECFRLIEVMTSNTTYEYNIRHDHRLCMPYNQHFLNVC